MSIEDEIGSMFDNMLTDAVEDDDDDDNIGNRIESGNDSPVNDNVEE